MGGAVEQIYTEAAEAAEAADLPWMEFELPRPPSKNQKKWKLGNQTPKVVDWGGQADKAFMALPPERRRGIRATCYCEFEAQFLHGRDKTADFHNFEEFLFDWLQDRGFIKNDKLCEWRASGWADNVGRDVKKGRVIVRLRPWMEAP